MRQVLDIHFYVRADVSTVVLFAKYLLGVSSERLRDVSLHVLKHIERHDSAEVVLSKSVKHGSLRIIAAESNAEALVMAADAAVAEHLDRLWTIADPDPNDIHFYSIGKFSSVHA